MPDPSIFEPDPLDEQALLTQLGGAPVSPVESLDQNLKRARLKALTAQALKRAEAQAKEDFVGPVEPAPMSVKLNTGGLGHVPQPTTPKIPLGQQPDPGPQLMVGPQEDRLTSPKIPLPDEPPPMPEPPRASAMNMLSAPYTTLSGAVGKLFDQSPEAGMGQRMTAAMEGAAPAFAHAPFESKAISEEARERGVETGLAGVGADILGDPGNLAGNPIVDIAKLVTALPAAIKGGVSMAHMLPLLVKGGIEAVPEARGLYSRVDEAAKLIPPKGAHPNKVASILKSNASAEELAFRKVPEFLATQGDKVTPESLLAHLKEHPAPMPEVKTLGGPQVPQLSPEDIDARFVESHVPPGHNPRNYPGYWEAYDRRTGSFITRGPSEAEVRRQSLVFGPRENDAKPKYAQYQLPGGETYRETLLKLPSAKAPANVELQQAFTKANEDLNVFRRENPDAELEGLAHPEYRELVLARNRLGEELTKSENAHVASQFRSGHFGGEPNILVHTRANERTLPTGERGRFIEEVQSDWHQQGKKKGYGQEKEVVAYYETPLGHVPIGYGKTEAEALANNPAWADLVDVKYKTEVVGEGVPDAPFKETWPDLGLKQQILEAANDPKAEWIGHTGGKTQAERYDLSKQVKRVYYLNDSQTLRAIDHDGSTVLDQVVPKDKVADYVGKDVATKLFESKEKDVWRDSKGAQRGHDLTGLDLQVGGEGMKHFYDNLLPKRLEKILKPFGGKVERGSIATGERTIRAHPDPSVQQTVVEPDMVEAWIARLTPEMKARINKEGLPLAALLAALGLGGAAKTQEQQQ